MLVIGSGAAGMYAAIEATRGGAQEGVKLLLADRSLIGRGGATVMAQMTVAVALGEEVPDDLAPSLRRHDRRRPRAVRREAGAAFVRGGAGLHPRARCLGRRLGAQRRPTSTATMAPGHDRPRCVYVDFINTGPAVSKTLRTHLARNPAIRKAGDFASSISR